MPSNSDPPVARGRYRVAVIGAGDMGGHHVAAWQALGHVVASVTDVDADRATRLAGVHGVATVHTDHTKAVSDDVDIVSVCLPLALHAPVVVAAARAGRHVFVEKPLAPTYAAADAMQGAVTEAGVAFGVGFQRNLAGGVALLRQWAAEGGFGHPMLATSDVLQEVRPKTAMHDRGGNNGPFTDAGCHYYLLWQTVFRSRPHTVYAQGRITAVGRPEVRHLDALAIDTGTVTITYESGDVATFTASWGLPAGSRMRGRSDRVVGPAGGAEGDPEQSLTRYDGADVVEVPVQPRDLHEVELGLFAEAIASGTPYPCGFQTGRQMMAVTDAVFESMATGRPAVVRRRP